MNYTFDENGCAVMQIQFYKFVLLKPGAFVQGITVMVPVTLKNVHIV